MGGALDFQLQPVPLSQVELVWGDTDRCPYSVGESGSRTTIMTGQATSNCAFGDDGRTLYMTADDYLMRVKLRTKGLGF